MSATFKIIIIFGSLILVILLGTAFGWAVGWLTKPAEVLGVENVENQWQFAYDTEEDLFAAVRQVCNAQVALKSASEDWERQQRQTQLIARMDNYARIASDYNGRMRDAFRAGLVKPFDVRETAFTLEEAVELLVSTEGLECE